MTSIAEKPERQSERHLISMPVKVEARVSQDTVWREVTHLESISKIGAGFYLSRPFEPGQLLQLTMPLDKELRRFDFLKEQYSVWGVVRHCHQTLRNKFSIHHVGVAFTGPKPPTGHYKTPSAIYKLGKLGKNGFWEISRESRNAERRHQPRYSIPVEIYIAVCDGQENVIAHEQTVTENISEGGASVFSALQLNIGDTVRFIKQHGGFSANAVVRGRRVGEDNLPRLHLEFVNGRFPLDGID